MTLSAVRFLLLFFLVFPGGLNPASRSDPETGTTGVTDSIAYKSPYFDDNERCFVCHGQNRYEYTNENLGRQVRAMMFSERIVTREDFYQSNHKSFSCTDCHSGDYVKFPHPGELRMELSYNCIDCHGGDDKFSQFNLRSSKRNISKVHISSSRRKVLPAGNAIALMTTT